MIEILSFLKCISDETRLKMLKLLMEGQFCVCQMQEILDKSQSSISQHLSYFKNLDLVDEEHDSKWTYFSINRKKYDYYISELISLSNKDLEYMEMNNMKDEIEAIRNENSFEREKNNIMRCCG